MTARVWSMIKSLRQTAIEYPPSPSPPSAVSASGHTIKQTRLFQAVTHAQGSTHKLLMPPSQMVLSRMQLILHTARRTSSRSLRDRTTRCLRVDENPTCPFPVSQGCKGLWHSDCAPNRIKNPPPFCLVLAEPNVPRLGIVEMRKSTAIRPRPYTK